MLKREKSSELSVVNLKMDQQVLPNHYQVAQVSVPKKAQKQLNSVSSNQKKSLVEVV